MVINSVSVMCSKQKRSAIYRRIYSQDGNTARQCGIAIARTTKQSARHTLPSIEIERKGRRRGKNVENLERSRTLLPETQRSAMG